MRISRKLKIILYHTFAITSVLLVSNFARIEIHKRYLGMNDLWKVDANTLIMGDSHGQVGVIESCFDNAKNVSQSAESLVYTYYKLEHYLKINPQLKRVILAVSYHSFTANDESYLHEYMRRYRFLLDNRLISYSLFYNDTRDVSVPEFLSRTVLPVGLLYDLYEYFLVSRLGAIPKWKGFQKVSRKSLIGNIEYLESAIQRHYYTSSGSLRDISEIKKTYLSNILALCNERNIDLLIVNTPTHTDYSNRIPGKFRDNFRQIVGSFTSDIQYIDEGSLVNTLEDKCFQDYDHLNYNGAMIFTSLIKKVSDKY